MRVEQEQLKAFLLDSSLVNSSDIDEAEKKAKKTKKSLRDVLLSDGKVNEDDLIHLEAYILGIPFVNLKNEKISFDVLSMIPEPIARTHNIVAFKAYDGSLEVAMLDPEDLETIDFIKKKSSLKILPRLTTPDSIKYALSQYQRSLSAEFSDIIKKESGSIKIISDEIGGEEKVEELKKLGEDLPVVKIVDTLLRHAILERGSDIHIEPTDKDVIVRYRIDGVLHDAMVLPKSAADGIVARIKILSSLRLDEKRLPQDGRFKIETPEERVAFRVSVLPVYNGEKVVLRLLHEGAKGFSLEALGFSESQIDKVQKTIKKPNGMILVTGPTGSGKTTTLYTVLDILNKPGVNISTVEDPIEYQMQRINQSQVRPEIGFSFSNGLRSLLRQDPDIIMVGEIRDNETASLAINASLTGHLVLSTLHTNSAAGSIPRLLDMKVEPFLLVSTLNMAVAQRLVRKLSKTKEKYFLNKDQLKDLGDVVDLDRMLEILKDEKVIEPNISFDKIPFYKTKQTKDSPDGYFDRIGIHEVLEVTETIKNLVMKDATSDEIENQAKKEGMITMLEDGIIKAVQGITTIEEVLRVTSE
ncbi:MAG: GspE/PulE family protein [Parcubacteria group bacterium]|nr:GspE/PulE family protein [Parcubacteria group bacterium]MCR4342954.1 GspE/PulE family protein [Patescibacteria group bacterium]